MMFCLRQVEKIQVSLVLVADSGRRPQEEYGDWWLKQEVVSVLVSCTGVCCFPQVDVEVWPGPTHHRCRNCMA